MKFVEVEHEKLVHFTLALRLECEQVRSTELGLFNATYERPKK